MIRTLMLFAGLTMLTMVAAPAATAPSSPAGVVDSFYRWYFSVNTTHGGWREHFPQTHAYLDSSLFALVSKMLAEENRAKGVILDFDPFVDAQEPATSFTVGAPISNGASVKVPVALHFGKGAGQGRVIVVLHKSGTWQIDNFSYGADGNLRSIIAQQMK